jgi:hypothetical protein
LEVLDFNGAPVRTKLRTYVIEIAFDPETKPASQTGGVRGRHPSASPFEKSTTGKPRHYRK